MAYVINKSDGTALTTLQDATVDNSTSITLVGRNYIGYGEAQNENYLFLLENFAHDTAPSRPIAGQLWFDNTINAMKLYDGDKWIVAGAAEISATAPTEPASGSFWFKSTAGTLYTWDGSQWVFIGPETSEGYGVTRAKSTTLISDTGLTYPVIELIVNDVVIGMITASPFTINTEANPRTGFTTLDAGLTLSSTTYVKGTLHGNADTATKLETRRNINSVLFDGTADITIKSSTTHRHISGDYIVGSDFDGSSEGITWSVDATSANTLGKVVARNSSGGFAAGLITADLAGDVTGNISGTTGNFSGTVKAARFVGATLSGNALTATEFETSRNINGVPFNGGQDITVPAAAGTLTGNSIANSVLFSSLTTLGTLVDLSVTGAITVNSNLTISATGVQSEVQGNRSLSLEANDGSNIASAVVISPDVSVLAGTGSNGGLVPGTTGTVDLGKSNLTWDNVYGNLFIGNLQGNADTATLATTTINIAGGSTGSFPYQTASGATSLLPAGAAGLVLHTSGAGGTPYWAAPTLSDLTPGDYITGSTYDGLAAKTFAVDATTSNTASKVVARDSSGNFAAGTITASLNGNATTATQATNNVLKVGDTMTGFLTLHANPTTNLHAATKKYVDDTVAAGVNNNLWAGATTLANVQATYNAYPVGTRVAFWEERNYSRPANSNGGSVSISDRYRRVVEKRASTWVNVG